MFKYSEYMSDMFIDNVLSPYLLRCKAHRTAVEYVGYVRLLCDTCRKDFLELTEDDVEYAVQKWQSCNIARRTIRTRLSCYSSISRFIKDDLELELNFINPFDSIVRPEVCDDIKPQKIPSIDEMDMIMSQAKKAGNMWYLILALVSRACISPSKITQITRDSVFCEDAVVSLYFKDKSIVRLPDDVATLFMSYINSVALSDSEGHIFFNKQGRALTLKNLDTKVADIIKRAEVSESYTLINIRSRGILELAKAGADEVTIANYANIGAMRTRQFMEAKNMIGECPANLVNYRLATV